MPNINDYRKSVQEAYENERRNGTLKSLLNSPSPENIRTVCLDRLEKKFNRKDFNMLCDFFGEASNIEELKNFVEEHEREKFIPIGRFLQRGTTKPNITITEMAAWLIDFQLRPFNNFYESYQVKNLEVKVRNEDLQPGDVETIKPNLVEKTNEDEPVNIRDIAFQPEDLTNPQIDTNTAITNPSETEETEPLIFLIRKRMMRVAAIFFCLFVMTTLFKSQQERYETQIAQTRQQSIPEQEIEPVVIEKKLPASKTSVLKETNKRCQSLTLKGKQCKRNATKGDYCWQHPLE